MIGEKLYRLNLSNHCSRNRFNLDVVPKNEADEAKIFWESQNTEVEEEPFYPVR
jgi:hypothetical protein